MRVALIDDLLSEQLPAGSNILVEYDPTSQWYNASLSIAAEWLRSEGRVSYHVAAEPPDTVRPRLKRQGLDVEQFEGNGRLRIFDWHAATLGQQSTEEYAFNSLKVADLSILFSKYLMVRPGLAKPSSDWLRILDDTSCLGRFNDEKNWVEFVLTRIFPIANLWKSTGIWGVISGIHSEWAYKRLEAAVDGVVDFRLEEAGDETRDIMRIRSMRNAVFDRRWRQLKLGDNFEVTLEKRD